MNGLRTVFLLGLMTGLMIFAGQLLGGRTGMMIGLAFAVVSNFVSFFNSDKLALRAHRAIPVTESEAPQLYEMTREMCQRDGMPMPRLYRLPDQRMNAFATGRSPSHAAVAVTDGLMANMSYDEVKGVVAHELAHIKNRDILTGSIAATMAGAIVMVAQFSRFFGRGRGRGGNPLTGILMMLAAPMIAGVIQMAVSRTREFAADKTGAQLAGTTRGLHGALSKLSGGAANIGSARESTAHMMIANPFGGGGLKKLFSTHPPMDQRLARLEELEGNLD